MLQISLLMIIIAKFQKIYNRKNGIHPDHRHVSDSSELAAIRQTRRDKGRGILMNIISIIAI